MESNIVGFQNLSFLDYPELPSSIIFFSGCNFSCPYCHNKEIAGINRPLFTINMDDIINNLKNQYCHNWIKGVVITGGEPTIHEKQLKKLLTSLFDPELLGLKVKLDTNGSNPSFLKEIIELKLIDYIAMDIKAPYSPYQLIKESAIHIMNSDIDYEFRTTAFPPWINKKSIEIIGKNIEGAKRFYLQQYRKVKDTINIKPYKTEELFELKHIISKYVNFVKIRGL